MIYWILFFFNWFVCGLVIEIFKIFISKFNVYLNLRVADLNREERYKDCLIVKNFFIILFIR